MLIEEFSSLEKEAELFVNTYYSYLDDSSQDEETTTEETTNEKDNIEANITTTETKIINEANTAEEASIQDEYNDEETEAAEAASIKRMIQLYQDEYNEGNVYMGDVFYNF